MGAAKYLLPEVGMRLTEARIRQLVRLTLLESRNPGLIDLDRMKPAVAKLIENVIDDLRRAMGIRTPDDQPNEDELQEMLPGVEETLQDTPSFKALARLCLNIFLQIDRAIPMIELDEDRLTWTISYEVASSYLDGDDPDDDALLEQRAGRVLLLLLNEVIETVRTSIQEQIYQLRDRDATPEEHQELARQVRETLEKVAFSVSYTEPGFDWSENFLENYQQLVRDAAWVPGR